jgi:hypothetical protein
VVRQWAIPWLAHFWLRFLNNAFTNQVFADKGIDMTLMTFTSFFDPDFPVFSFL